MSSEKVWRPLASLRWGSGVRTGVDDARLFCELILETAFTDDLNNALSTITLAEILTGPFKTGQTVPLLGGGAF